MAFDILELPQIPRERDKLKAIIGHARYQRRRSRMMRFASYAMIAIGFFVLLLNGCNHTSAASPLHQSAVYLPYVPR